MPVYGSFIMLWVIAALYMSMEIVCMFRCIHGLKDNALVVDLVVEGGRHCCQLSLIFSGQPRKKILTRTFLHTSQRAIFSQNSFEHGKKNTVFLQHVKSTHP